MLNQFKEAYEALEESEYKSLSLKNRRDILFLFGEFQEKINRTDFTKAKKFRAILALRCYNKVLPLWKLAFSDDDKLSELSGALVEYIDNGENYDELDECFDSVFSWLEDECEQPEMYLLAQIGYALIDAADCALSDEEILAPDFEDATDEDVDSDTWDAAYRACMVYECAFGQEEETVLFFRESFWKWYIDEAAKLYNEFCG